jgi:hypothetical protein
MAPAASLLIAVFYLTVAAVIAIHEYKVVTTRGGDSFTVVLAFVLIYLLLPSIGIYSLLGLYGADLRTGNYFFDKVLSKLDFVDSLMVCLLTTIFIEGLYISFGFKRTANISTKLPTKELNFRKMADFLSLATLTFICGKFFIELGDSFLERYINLILFRNQDSTSVRTFFSANAFSLTQTFVWLAASVCFIYLSENKHLKAVAYFALMFFATFLMGSRRGFIFPAVIIYLSFVLLRRDLYLRKMIFFIPAVIFWVGFGKELTGSIAYDVDYENLLDSYDSLGSMTLRALSDIGISQIQSLAVLQHFEVFPDSGLTTYYRFFAEFRTEWLVSKLIGPKE